MVEYFDKDDKVKKKERSFLFKAETIEAFIINFF